MGSLWTLTSSLGFPGGSLGHLGIAGAVMLSVGLLGHIWILLFRTTPFASACCNVGSVTSGCHLLSFSIIRVAYNVLCRRVCDVPVVPQVLISLLCFDSVSGGDG